MPISCTGRAPNDTIARISIAVPIVPEKMWPGTSSSSTIKARPSQKKMNARVGSSRRVQEADEAADRAVEDRNAGGLERDRVSRRRVPRSLRRLAASRASVVGAIRSMTSSCERLFRADAGRVGHERLGDVGVAIVFFGDRSDRRGGVVHRLVGTHRSVDADGGRGTDVRAGCHGRDVTRQQHERPSRRGARARRGDVAQDRDVARSRSPAVISRVDETRPPGVSISISTAAAPASAASAMPFCR